MTDTEMNPAASLAGYLCQTTPEQAVKAAMELCEQLPGDPERFHGGVWPGNVTLDGDGKAVLGMPISTPAAQRPANQVEYLAPEFFWDGESSAAADVFSVGLMIYAGCNKGFLPFQPEKDELTNQDRASALRRRMKGEAIPAPEGVSDDLKRVLEKALAYKPEDRYITAKELLFALHWTDEALGPEKDEDAAAAAVPMEEAAPEAEAAAVAAEEAPAPAPMPEEPPVPEESTEEMLREADQVLAAAAAGLAAVGGAAAAAAASHKNDGTSAEDGEAPQGEPDGPAEGDAPAEGEASPEGESPAAGGEAVNDEAGDTPAGEDAPLSGEAAAASAAGAAAAAAGMAAAGGVETTAAKKEYKVRKDFEHSPDKKAPTVAPAKKKSKAVPILCGIAAAALLGGVGYMVFGNPGSPIAPPEATEQTAIEAPPSPVVITPEPSATPKPTAKPTATPKASPEASPNASPDASARPSDGTVIVTPAPGTLEGIVGAGGAAGNETGTGTGTTGNNTGTGTTGGNTGTGTGTGSGNTGTGGNAGTGTGGNTGTGGSGTGSGGTSWGGGSGTGSGGGTSWGGGSGTGSGGGTSWGGGSGGGTSTTPTPGYTVTPADDTVYITGVGVNVRSGPGTSYPIIGSASTGYELKRTGITGNWSRVLFKGTTGYVSNTYLSTTNPTPSVTATPAPQETPGATTPEPAPRYTVTGGDLTYADAKAQAQASGGLTVIRSEDDFQAVVRQLNNGGSGVEYAWLGVEYDAGSACWRWSDGTVLYTGDSHWASGNPKAGDDLVLLSKQGGSWQYISLSSASFDPAAYAGKLGYVTGS